MDIMPDDGLNIKRRNLTLCQNGYKVWGILKSRITHIETKAFSKP